MNNLYEEINRYYVYILTAAISILACVILIFGQVLYSRNLSQYYTGQIIETNIRENKIEVEIDRGPRVFVNNIGEFNLAELKYGDYVELELKNGYYKITGHTKNIKNKQD